MFKVQVRLQLPTLLSVCSSVCLSVCLAVYVQQPLPELIVCVYMYMYICI